jgi:hypothetical protein
MNDKLTGLVSVTRTGGRSQFAIESDVLYRVENLLNDNGIKNFLEHIGVKMLLSGMRICTVVAPP